MRVGVGTAVGSGGRWVARVGRGAVVGVGTMAVAVGIGRAVGVLVGVGNDVEATVGRGSNFGVGVELVQASKVSNRNKTPETKALWQ